MAAFIQAGEIAGPAGGTHRGGGEGVGKAHPAVAQQVEIRGLDDAVAGAAHQVGALIVGKQEQDVGATHDSSRSVVRRAPTVEPAADVELRRPLIACAIDAHGHLPSGITKQETVRYRLGVYTEIP